MEFLKDRRVGMTIDVPVGNDAISLLKSSSSSSNLAFISVITVLL